MKTNHFFLLLSVSILMLAGLSACNLLAPAGDTGGGIQVPTPNAGAEIDTVMPTSTPMEASAPPPQQPKTVKTVATFDMGNSGSICPNRSTEIEFGLPPYIGDLGDTYSCEGFWTFDIGEIPAKATILSAILQPGECIMQGDPLAYGDAQGKALSFEFVAAGSLDVKDWGMGGEGNLALEQCPDTIDLTSYIQSHLAPGFDTVQIRAYLISGNYSNGKDDYISYDIGLMPVLTLEYSYLP